MTTFVTYHIYICDQGQFINLKVKYTYMWYLKRINTSFVCGLVVLAFISCTLQIYTIDINNVQVSIQKNTFTKKYFGLRLLQLKSSLQFNSYLQIVFA